MATIVNLNAAAAMMRPGRALKSDRRSSADVVLFPGVRYERGSDTSASGRARTGRKRDRLDLED